VKVMTPSALTLTVPLVTAIAWAKPGVSAVPLIDRIESVSPSTSVSPVSRSSAALVVSWLILRSPERRLLCTGLALILGGAIGNLVDRLMYGHVVDFVDLHAFGWHWPAFNIADSGITVGAGLVILEGFLHRDAHEAAPRG